MTPMSRNPLWEMWTVLLCGSAILSHPTIARAQGVGWFVELSPDKRDLIVYVDARRKPTNESLQGVTYAVEFHDASGRTIKTNSFGFTDARHPALAERKLYLKTERHGIPNAASVKGLALNWATNISGDKADDPGQRVPPFRGPPSATPSERVIIPSEDVVVPPPPPLGSRIAGTWSVTMRSAVSNQTYTIPANIVVRGQSVTGTLDVGDGSRRQLSGLITARGDSINLTRVTGLNTTQYYRLAWRGNILSGRFRNVGQYPDSGSVEFRR
jgi:hypothetical protein